MLLFQKPFWAGLTDGSITLTFRRWQQPRVRAGGRYRCHPIGVLEVDAVERVRVADIDDAQAHAAGFPDREALLAYLERDDSEPLSPDTEVFRVRLHHGGDGDRVEAALDDDLSSEDVERLKKKLAALDARSTVGPFTRKTLALIGKKPRVAARLLAEQLRRDKLEFKADVVKLKKLGLTQSFEVGYELSPRGRAFLAATAQRKKVTRGYHSR